MANDLTKRPEPTLPGLALPGAVAALAESFDLTVEGSRTMINRFPTQGERQTMQERNVALAVKLRPIKFTVAEKDRAMTLFGAFFAGYPSLRSADTLGMCRAYVAHLMDLPLFAVEAAISDVIAGRVRVPDGRGGMMKLDPDFAPTSVRLHEVAQEHIVKLATERMRIERVLTAKHLLQPAISPERRAAMGAELQALADGMRAKSADMVLDEAKAASARRSRERDNRSILAEYEKRGMEPQYAANGMLISPMLIDDVKRHAAASKKHKRRASQDEGR